MFIVEDVGEYLKSNNIKPSYQRIKIYDYLLSEKNHPTADVIYKALNKEIPTLSKTTVYNTLKLFVKNKIAKIITIEENEARFDADIKIHGHFRCEKCCEVYDFEYRADSIEVEGIDNFEISSKNLYFDGICQKCKKMS
jgi:Fe2+ or Zn2+ uptake regulation protein